MKKIFLLSAFLFIVNFVFAEKAATFPGINNPKNLLLNGEDIVITDYPQIYIFSSVNYSLKKKFGAKGQGPGEFYIYDGAKDRKIRGLITTILPDTLVVNSCGLLSFFSRAGQIKKMVKNDYYRGGRWFLPLGNIDRFVGYQMERKGKWFYATVNLYNEKLQKNKELFRCVHFLKDTNFSEKKNFFEEATLSVIYRVFEDKIFLVKGGSDEFAIEVFGKDGEKLNTITLDLEKIKLPPNYIERVHAYFRVKFKQALEANIKRTDFPEYFPPIHDFTVADKKIYVFTYKRNGDKNELLILDLCGKQLKKTMATIEERDPERFFPYAVHNGKLYQIIEDEDTGDWSLFIHLIK